MTGRTDRANRVATVTWAGIAEIGLGGVINIWSMSATAAARAGYGRTGSIALLAVSMLATAVGVVLSRERFRIGRRQRIVAGTGLAMIAGCVVPLVLLDLLTPGSSGIFILLAQSIIGMCVVAISLTRKNNHDR